MFNLLIAYDPESWNLAPYEFDKGRVAVEYTADEISERYKFLDEEAIKELKSFPSLFATESESSDSRIGYINSVRIRARSVVIEYEFDPALPPIPAGTIEKLKASFDIGRFELTRTHWAIKDENLFEILVKQGYLTEEQVNSSKFFSNQKPPAQTPPIVSAGTLNTHQVFIVHGQDELAKLDMASFIKSLGLEPIILHQQASSGRTIIEKIEAYSDVGFAVVLYTPCDVGARKADLRFLPRARQNVVFEHGYLIGKLGRPRVSALVKGLVETPNDISGVVYINLDDQGIWKSDVVREMKSAGYAVELPI